MLLPLRMNCLLWVIRNSHLEGFQNVSVLKHNVIILCNAIIYILDFFFNGTHIQHPSRYLLVQSQKWKHKNNMWSLFKVNYKDTQMKSLISLYCKLWTDFTQWSGASIFDFEYINAGWDHPTILFLWDLSQHSFQPVRKLPQ